MTANEQLRLHALRRDRNILLCELCESRGRTPQWRERRIRSVESLNLRIKAITDPAQEPEPAKPEPTQTRSRDVDWFRVGVITALVLAITVAVLMTTAEIMWGGQQ